MCVERGSLFDVVRGGNGLSCLCESEHCYAAREISNTLGAV